MKKNTKEVLIVSQVFEDAIMWDESYYSLKQTMKKVKLFVKSKVRSQSAEC